jgi:hypothetical protein
MECYLMPTLHVSLDTWFIKDARRREPHCSWEKKRRSRKVKRRKKRKRRRDGGPAGHTGLPWPVRPATIMPKLQKSETVD